MTRISLAKGARFDAVKLGLDMGVVVTDRDLDLAVWLQDCEARTFLSDLAVSRLTHPNRCDDALLFDLWYAGDFDAMADDVHSLKVS